MPKFVPRPRPRAAESLVRQFERPYREGIYVSGPAGLRHLLRPHAAALPLLTQASRNNPNSQPPQLQGSLSLCRAATACRGKGC